MIRNQLCDINISVFVTYFTHFQNDENRYAEVNKIANDVEVHDYNNL